MPNFFEDNEDIKFHMDHMDLLIDEQIRNPQHFTCHQYKHKNQ